MENFEIFQYDIFCYIGNSKRPLIEGEALFKANHVLLCGIVESGEDFLSIIGLCIQSSNISGSPHEVRIKILKARNDKVLECTCSCVAGLSGRCKHVLAVLFYLNRETVQNLEDLSCTDLKQQWGKIKNDSKKMLAVIPIAEFCHVRRSRTPYKPLAQRNEGTLEEIRKLLVSGAKGSEAEKYEKYNNLPQESIKPAFENNCSSYLESILKDCSFHEEFFKKYEGNYISVQLTELSKELYFFYVNNIALKSDDAIQLCCKTTSQSCVIWHNERKKRITGSNCYSFLTYNNNPKPDWTSKIKKIVNSSFKGNSNTIYGLKCEPQAISAYEKAFGTKVTRLGLFVHPNYPFLGFSPDGVTVEQNLLIEIKSPVSGQNQTATEIVKDLPYINGSIENKNLTLKRKHPYFAQIQLGMGLLKCTKCHFIIYSSFDNTLVVIEIVHDNTFFQNMYKTLNFIYFNFMLPEIVKLSE